MGNLLRAIRLRLLGFFLFLLLAALVAPHSVSPVHAKEPLKQGQNFPDLELLTPSEANQAAYLGLPAGGGKTFRLSQIKQPWVLIEVFNMYCTICQGEAKKVNQLYEKISQGPLKDKLALIGIGAGNSPFEVQVFRNRYSIKFPLFSDGAYKAHKAVGEPRTPYFLLVSARDPKLPIALANLGSFGQVSDFLADLKNIMDKN
jgi:peroxiredoxin